jgi:hypothetical protein
MREAPERQMGAVQSCAKILECWCSAIFLHFRRVAAHFSGACAAVSEASEKKHKQSVQVT